MLDHISHFVILSLCPLERSRSEQADEEGFFFLILFQKSDKKRRRLSSNGARASVLFERWRDREYERERERERENVSDRIFPDAITIFIDERIRSPLSVLGSVRPFSISRLALGFKGKMRCKKEERTDLHAIWDTQIPNTYRPVA